MLCLSWGFRFIQIRVRRSTTSDICIKMARKTTVKRHNRKGKPVRKHTRKIKGGKIAKDDRKVFTLLSTDFPREYGGNIDFDRTHNLERYTVIRGHKEYVDVDDDYEASWHSHTESDHPEPPSASDLITLLKSPKQQVEIVFNGQITYVIIPTKKAAKLRRIPTANLNRRFDNHWTQALMTSDSMEEVERKYLNSLRREGFRITRNTTPHKPLHIPIKIVEPPLKRVKR